jgi:hypothetical protein
VTAASVQRFAVLAGAVDSKKIGGNPSFQRNKYTILSSRFPWSGLELKLE